MLKNKSNFLLILILFCSVLPVLGETNRFTQLPDYQVITAYCACEKCCGKWAKYKKTASGQTPVEGITCAASRRIAFGTKLKIDGVGIRIVQDRLAQKYDNRIDLFFNSHKEALNFGKKKLRVTSTK